MLGQFRAALEGKFSWVAREAGQFTRVTADLLRVEVDRAHDLQTARQQLHYRLNLRFSLRNWKSWLGTGFQVR